MCAVSSNPFDQSSSFSFVVWYRVLVPVTVGVLCRAAPPSARAAHPHAPTRNPARGPQACSRELYMCGGLGCPRGPPGGPRARRRPETENEIDVGSTDTTQGTGNPSFLLGSGRFIHTVNTLWQAGRPPQQSPRKLPLRLETRPLLLRASTPSCPCRPSCRASRADRLVWEAARSVPTGAHPGLVAACGRAPTAPTTATLPSQPTHPPKRAAQPRAPDGPYARACVQPHAARRPHEASGELRRRQGGSTLRPCCGRPAAWCA